MTLWFEHDLLDQLQLLQLLDWFAAAPVPSAKLGIVCIGTFPGVEAFRGLGQLRPAQMGTLLHQRAPVTPLQLDLTHHASMDAARALKLSL